jgi:hypothetical protein
VRNAGIRKAGFFQAVGVAGYCALVALLIWKGNEIFGQMNSYFGPVLFLLLFATSALICGVIVFYKPYRLFLKGKGGEAMSLVVATSVWLLFMIAILLLGILCLG